MPADSPQVLIAGAGPVGLSAAHELARRGLRVRIIDAATGPATTSRAVAVHPRTLETFDQMHVAPGILARGRRNRAFTMYAKGRRLVRLEADYHSMPTRFPFTLIIEQTETEAALRTALGSMGVTVEWGVRLERLEQDEDGVDVELSHPAGGVENCRVPWLIGCDGGHSTVRKQLGLELIGDSRDTWMIADATVASTLPADSIYWAHTGKQTVMMVPYARDGQWRLLDTAPAPGEPQPQQTAARFSALLSAGFGRQVKVGVPQWSSVFTFQQRMVARMHQGRVFVAGDAAHVHSPASGQGMNTGIQEAYNLAWKLALVEQGHARCRLLDTYSAERVPVGEALLGSTRTATFLVQLKQALAAVVLPVFFAVVRATPTLRRRLQRKVLGGMSGLRLNYEKSPLTLKQQTVQRPGALRSVLSVPPGARCPGPGHRAAAATAVRAYACGPWALAEELRDVRFSLLFASDGRGAAEGCARTAARAAARHRAWLSVRTVGGYGWPGPDLLPDPDGSLSEALGLVPGSWVLIRPDGYIAARRPVLTEESLREVLDALGLAMDVSVEDLPAAPVRLKRITTASRGFKEMVRTGTSVRESR